MSNIGYRVFENINRPTEELIQGFKGMQVANIADCMNRMGALDASIHRMNGQNMLGTAYTVKVPSGDNLLIFLAIEKAQPGDIIVIDGEGSMERALVGEILSKFAESKKLGGFLINGCIRDYEMISKLDIPVFAKGLSPNGPYRNGPGEIGVPVTIGGKVIQPGDIIVADSDGVVVVNPEDAKVLQKKASELQKREDMMAKNLDEGKGLDLSWLHEKLKNDGCEFIK